MANGIQQNLRGSTKDGLRKWKAAQAFAGGATPVGSSRELGQVFANPALWRCPDYLFDATTDDAVAFTIWDSVDPLANSLAAVNGETPTPLLFAANTLTPVTGFGIVANDDTIGVIAVQALILGSATAPTLVSAFRNEYVLKATFSSGAATRVVAESSPEFTIVSTAVATGRYTIALPASVSGHIVCGLDSAAATVATAALHAQPNAYVTSTGAGEIRTFGAATPALTAPGDTHILHARASIREKNGHLLRLTNDSADTADTMLKFGITTASTPDSLNLQVTGITGAELRWTGGIWIGETIPIAFRTQV
jgi:hypothetical protein